MARGVTWTTPEQVTNDVNFDHYPSAFLASDGKLWLAWDTDRTGRWNIFYKTYSGGVWSQDTQLTSELFSNRAPSITQLKNGTILIFYQAYTTNNWDIYYRALRGSTFSDPVPVITSTFTDAAPSASVATDGTLWLAFERRPSTSDSDIYYITLSNGTWSSETALVTGTTTDIIPNLLVAREGKVLISWTRIVTGTNYDVYYEYYTSGVWSAAKTLANTNDLEMGWSFAQDRNGGFWFFYSRELSAGAQQYQDEIYYTTSSDAVTWSSSTRLTTDPSGQIIQDTEARAVQGPDKRLWLFWDSDRTNNWEVWLMKTDPIVTHDVAAVSVAPSTPPKTAKVGITAKVTNLGDYTESLAVTLTVNGTVAYTWTVPLTAGNTALLSTTISLDWKNGQATYQLGLSVAQVTGEPQANLPNNTTNQYMKLFVAPGFGCRVGNTCLT